MSCSSADNQNAGPEEKKSIVTRILNAWSARLKQGQGSAGQFMPCSVDPSSVRIPLMETRFLGITLIKATVPSEELCPSIEKAVYDHPWSFLRIRIAGDGVEELINSEMMSDERRVGRFRLIHGSEFLGSCVQSKGLWFLIIRGRQNKASGRMTIPVSGQSSFEEITPYRTIQSAINPGKIVVQNEQKV